MVNYVKYKPSQVLTVQLTNVGMHHKLCVCAYSKSSRQQKNQLHSTQLQNTIVQSNIENSYSQRKIYTRYYVLSVNYDYYDVMVVCSSSCELNNRMLRIHHVCIGNLHSWWLDCQQTHHDVPISPPCSIACPEQKTEFI